jgi:phospholipid/cholesterol/gamma-HCH transport system substrate-binding protein
MGGAESTVSNVQDITRKINEGEGTIGRLVNDDALIRDVEEIVDDAGDFVDRITRLRAQVGLRSEYNFRASSLKTYVSLRLIPKEDKFYLIEVVDDPRGRTRFVDRTTLTNDPLQPPVLRETIAETTSDLKFSFQFGKQWHFMTGRFGIIESTGGVGLDAEFLDDTLKLSLDVFDFQADTWPRLKWLFSWEFVQHVYVAAGVDDIVNEVGRDYFLGLGVTFTDDDLKSLLTIGGIPSP